MEKFGYKLEKGWLKEPLRTNLPPEFYLVEAEHEVGLFHEGRPRDACVEIYDISKVTCEQILDAAKEYQTVLGNA